jgi:hypothetical protein
VKRETDDTLLAWLSNQPDKLEKHLDRCPEDIDRLERLTELAPQQVMAMGHSVAAPDDIAERVISRMRVDPRLKEAGAAFADLFSLGFRTVRVVFGGDDQEHEPDPADTGDDDTQRNDG